MDSTQRTRPRGGGSPVGLVIFIILTVVLAVLSYWGFAKYKETQELLTKAEAEQVLAETNLKRVVEENDAFKASAGTQTGESLKDPVTTLLGKASEVEFGSQTPETAKDALLLAVKVIEALRDERDSLITRNAELNDQMRSLQARTEAAGVAYSDSVKTKLTELDALNKKLDDTKNDLQAQLDKEKADRVSLRNEYFARQDEWKDTEMRYILHVAQLLEKNRQLGGEEVQIEQADAVVTTIDRLNQRVTINIGADAGVKAAMRFVVFSKDSAGKVTQKGVIQVIKVAPKVAVAQILPESLKKDTAIGRNDFVFNLAGPEKRTFVFAGETQLYDMDEWTNFIRSNGGDVVEEVQKGDQVADYLIMGKFDEQDTRVKQLVRDARDFGLKILKEENLKESLGLL